MDDPGVSAVKPQGRAGKKMVAGRFDRAVAKRVRAFAIEEETTVQDLVGEALNLLFRQRGLPALARIERATSRHG